jgi:hypothetical protein
LSPRRQQETTRPPSMRPGWRRWCGAGCERRPGDGIQSVRDPVTLSCAIPR